MRVFLLFLSVILLIAFFIAVVFLIANKNTPSGVILKLITPVFGGLLWTIVAIGDYSRLAKEKLGLLVISSQSGLPFRLPYEFGIDKEVNLQDFLPVYIGNSKHVNEAKGLAASHILNEFRPELIGGAIWEKLDEFIPREWSDRRIKITGFGGQHTSTERIGSPKGLPVNMGKYHNQYKIVSKDENEHIEFSSMVKYFPEDTKFDWSTEHLHIKTKYIDYSIKWRVTGGGSISSNKALVLGDDYGWILSEINREAFGINENLTRVIAVMHIERKVNFWFQWNEESERQQEWFDKLTKELIEEFDWSNYEEKFEKRVKAIHSYISKGHVTYQHNVGKIRSYRLEFSELSSTSAAFKLMDELRSNLNGKTTIEKESDTEILISAPQVTVRFFLNALSIKGIKVKRKSLVGRIHIISAIPKATQVGYDDVAKHSTNSRNCTDETLSALE